MAVASDFDSASGRNISPNPNPTSISSVPVYTAGTHKAAKPDSQASSTQTGTTHKRLG